MSEEKNQSTLDTAIGKVDAFCSCHSLFKSDEELRNSFDSFLVAEHTLLDDAARERHANDSDALEEIVPVLYELADLIKKS